MIKKVFNIEGKNIGDNNPVYFIADIAANHDGDLNRVKDLIYLAADAGADAAKFQHFTAKTIVSDFGFRSLGSQQSHQAKWKKSVFQVYKDASQGLRCSRPTSFFAPAVFDDGFIVGHVFQGLFRQPREHLPDDDAQNGCPHKRETSFV